jgi:hypothetical protein
MSSFDDHSASASNSHTHLPFTEPDITITSSNIITTSSSSKTDFSTSIYNQPKYTMDSPAYIFKNRLFTKTLLPIDPTKEREVLIQCNT